VTEKTPRNKTPKARAARKWPPQKHDRAYRRFFSHPEMVEDLVRGFVAEPWVEHLDFEHMEQVPDVFVGEKFDRRDADTVWKIRFKGRHRNRPPIYVFFIFEFLSGVDPWAAVRLMAYVALFYQRLAGSREDQGDPARPGRSSLRRLHPLVDGDLPRFGGTAGAGGEDQDLGGLHHAGREHFGVASQRPPGG